MRVLSLTLASCLLASACSQGSYVPFPTDNTSDDAGTGTDDALPAGPADMIDNGAPSTMYPAPFPTPPQVITGGGPILRSPRFVPVFFAGDDPTMIMKVTDFLSKIGATKYWTTATSEYNVLAGSSTRPVQLAEMAQPNLTDGAIQSWLAAKLNGNDPAFPPPDANTLYVLHYPDTVTITQQGGPNGSSTSCTDFGGYHNSVQLNGQHRQMRVPYAVIPRCANFGNLSGIDAVTGAESHELIEAATDPFPQAAPAYAQVDDDHIYWTFALGGGELGDMCAQDPRAFVTFPGLPYVVQRTWSNQAAMAGNDPCVPALSNEVYFNAVPELSDAVSIGNGQITTTGVSVPVGQSKTIALDLFSDGATGASWSVRAQDAASLQGRGSTLGFTFDRPRGQNGEKLHLTIKSTRQSQYGVAIFIVTSTLGGNSHYWFGLVDQTGN